MLGDAADGFPSPVPVPAPAPAPFPEGGEIAKIFVSDIELDALARVAHSEVGHFGKYGDDQLKGGLGAVVDTIINRVAQPHYPMTIGEVVDAPKQFSAINPIGTWANLPKATPKNFAIVRDHLIARCAGQASAIKGATHFLNPHLSSPSAMNRWGRHVVDNAVAVFGSEERRDVHFHGFAPNAAVPPKYFLALQGYSQLFNGDGTLATGMPRDATAARGVSAEAIVASAVKEWNIWGKATWNLLSGKKTRKHRDDERQFSRYVRDTYCALVRASPSMADIENDNYAWSAVFISYVLSQAGLSGDQFKFSQSHSIYIVDSIKAKKSNDLKACYWGHRLNDSLAVPEPGDVIGCTRTGGLSFDQSQSYFDKTGRYDSHTDIIVAKRPGEIDVIGGNVRDSVTMKTLAIDTDGRVGDRNFNWFVVMKRR